DVDRPLERPVRAEQRHRVAGDLDQRRGRGGDLRVGGLDILIHAVELLVLREAQPLEGGCHLNRKRFPSPACGGGQGGGFEPACGGGQGGGFQPACGGGQGGGAGPFRDRPHINNERAPNRNFPSPACGGGQG